MENCKPKATPMDKGFQIYEKNYMPYQQLIGGSMYLTTKIRPDMGYLVSYLSRFLD